MGQPVHPRPRVGSRSHPLAEHSAYRPRGGFCRRLRDLLHRQRQGHWAERSARGRSALRRHSQQEAQSDSRGFFQRPSRRPAAGIQLPLLRGGQRPAAFAKLTPHGRIHPRKPRSALPEGMDPAQLRLVDRARAAPHRQLQKGDGSRSPTSSQRPRRREQSHACHNQADSRRAVKPRAAKRHERTKSLL